MRTILGIITIALYLSAQSNEQQVMIAAGVDAPNTPTDSPGAGTYSSTQSVTLSDPTAAAILYTTDGSTPVCPATGTLYTGAISVSVTTTIKAIGCNGVTGGGVLTSVYTISGGGTVAFVNVNTSINQAGGSFSQSMTVNSGLNLVAFARVVWDDTPGLSVSAITYGGQAMTAAGAAVYNSDSNIYAQAFMLANPPIGSNTLAITVTGANEIFADLIVFSGVNQATPVAPGSYTTSTGFSSTTMSVTIPSAVGNQTFSVGSIGNEFYNTAMTNQTLDSNNETGSFEQQTDHETDPAGASSVTHTWTWSGDSGSFALLGLSVAAQ